MREDTQRLYKELGKLDAQARSLGVGRDAWKIQAEWMSKYIATSNTPKGSPKLLNRAMQNAINDMKAMIAHTKRTKRHKMPKGKAITQSSLDRAMR